jgi:hypothetical protein
MTEIGQFSAQWRAEMALRIEEATRPRLEAAEKLTGPLPGRPRIRLQLEAGAVYAVNPRYEGDRPMPLDWGHFDLPALKRPPRRSLFKRRI